MKKKLLSLLMVTALTASLVAGCGSNGDSKDKSSGSLLMMAAGLSLCMKVL